MLEVQLQEGALLVQVQEGAAEAQGTTKPPFLPSAHPNTHWSEDAGQLHHAPSVRVLCTLHTT